MHGDPSLLCENVRGGKKSEVEGDDVNGDGVNNGREFEVLLGEEKELYGEAKLELDAAEFFTSDSEDAGLHMELVVITEGLIVKEGINFVTSTSAS